MSSDNEVGRRFASLPRWRQWLSLLNWRRDPGYELAGRPVNPGLVVYAMADGAFAVWDPARNAWKCKGAVDTPE